MIPDDEKPTAENVSMPATDSAPQPSEPVAAETATIGLGDVVQLKSGGCQMTVSAIDDGHVECVWFDGDEGSVWRGPKSAHFPVAVLALVTPPPPLAVASDAPSSAAPAGVPRQLRSSEAARRKA